MQKMFKKSQVTCLLFVLFITDSTVLAQDEVEGSRNEAKNRTKVADSLATKIFCSDNACTAKSGSCQSTLNIFSSCKEVDNSLCGAFCSCCVACSGTCGTDSDGTCKRSCSSTEEQITGCTGRNCRCCRTLQKCGAGDAGSCKSSCNTNIEDEDGTATCTVTGYKCCVPKTGCTANCGWNNRFTCRTSSQCPWYQTQFGSCPSGCKCCGSFFG
ncbi:keratin-associated protein 5-9-like [Palaemon carinicauda]|uniref:keratin-associated protein 5-9-like n=1 Tax=Palaemon carinicauda TaxID=392227 RepID=UPI0035B69A29